MAKISKNINRLRMSRNMTQEELAQKLFVSRQAVSSWENNRTQPDVEMIKKLSDVFGVPVEELLYGEKRNTKLEESVKTGKTLFTVFSIIGSLFVGVGLIILIVGLWDKFPAFTKASVSFIPLLLGQGAAVYTYAKKFDNVSWREGASVLWAMGITATVGLISSVLGIHLGALGCLLIDALLILPILYFFKVVSPLVFYFGFSVAGAVGVLEESGSIRLTVGTLILLTVVGLLYTCLNRKNFKDIRYEYSLWISVLASVSSALAICFLSDSGFFTIPMALAVCICLLNKNDSKSEPFYPVGILGTVAAGVISTYCHLNETVRYDGCSLSDLFAEENIFALVLSVSLFAIGFTVNAKRKEKDKKQTAFCCVGALAALLPLAGCVLDFFSLMGIALFALAFVMCVIMIVKGAIEKKYFAMNVGLVGMLTLMFFVISAVYMNMITMGVMFLVCGFALFGANFWISRKIKSKQNEINDKEVEDNE